MAYLNPNDRLWNTLEAITQDEGLLLYDLERRSANMLCVFVRKQSDSANEAGKQAGVTSEDCSRLCRRLMILFQAEGPDFGLPNEPEIEVSSPGINRKLRTLAHWQMSVGERLKVKFIEPVQHEDCENNKMIIGNVVKVNEQEGIEFQLEQTGSLIDFKLEQVVEARVDFKF